MLCAASDAEAKRQYDYFVFERGDWEAAAAEIQMAAGQNQSHELQLSRVAQERAIAWQWAHPLVGTAQRIVDQMAELVAAGIDGLAITWMNFEEGYLVSR